MTGKFENFQAHFSVGIPGELKAFVRDEVLLHSRYLFVKRMTSTVQRGYCTHCKSNHVINSTATLKHNEGWRCEKCKSIVVVKQWGRGRGKMIDKAYVVWYEKSKSTPGAIVATGYNVAMNYTKEMGGVTTFDAVARYVFEIGKATMMHRNFYYAGCYSTKVLRYSDGWSFASTVWSMIGKNSYTQNSSQSMVSVQNSVIGTPFQYSKWELFSKDNSDLVYFFSAFSKYPFIEYLSKMGMHDLVEAMVYRYDLHKSINHRGKSMEKILGLSKKEVKEWKHACVPMKPLTLKTYKWFRDQGAAITWGAADGCEALLDGSYYLERLEYLLKYLPLDQIMKYIQSQMKKHPRYNRTILSTLISWKDYLSECAELEMDLMYDRVLLPNNLHTAHQNTTRSVKIKKDEVINKKILNLQPSLANFLYEKDGLFIRPARSSIELFDEGKALDHCVGRYANSYSEGKIAILFIRKVDDLDAPFYTVEIDMSRLEITQCRGLKNCSPTEEVNVFLKSFNNERLKLKRRSKNKAKTA